MSDYSFTGFCLNNNLNTRSIGWFCSFFARSGTKCRKIWKINSLWIGTYIKLVGFSYSFVSGLYNLENNKIFFFGQWYIILILNFSDIKVGDLIVIQKDKRVPADIILLRTTEKSGASFIRTDQLDGETDWKLRTAVPITQNLQHDQVLSYFLTFSHFIIIFMIFH